MENIFIIIAVFLIGGIPFGFIFTKMANLGDIRDIGSGNIGATNVLRTGNKKLAALTLFCDAFKGYLMVILPPLLFKNMIIPPEKLALIVILGHVFSVFLKFKGGKGVATAIGTFLALNIYLGIFTIIIWGVAFRFFKISSLSALIAASFTPIIALGLNVFEMGQLHVMSFASIALVIIYTHRDNIKRLLSGDEDIISPENTKI